MVPNTLQDCENKMTDLIHCKYDALVAPKSLKEHAKNRNKHPKEQVTRLAKLLKHYGFRHPIIVDAEDKTTIIVGRGRQMSSIEAGFDLVPVVYQTFESEDQKYSFIQADNAISEWSKLDLASISMDIGELGPDFDIELLGLKDFTIDVAEKYTENDKENSEEPAEPITKPGDLWQLGPHRLLCANSTDILQIERLLNGETVDMIYTDPPYGINEQTDRDFASRTRLAKGGTFKKIIGDENTNAAVDSWNIAQAMKIPLQIFWGANHYAGQIANSPSWIIWDKRETEKQHDHNSDCEMAWCSGHNKSVRLFRHLWKGMIKASEHGQARVHPTQKPVALAEWCFKNYGEPKVVLDLFAGSGSTLIACETTGRKCYTMELEPTYCDVIVARWEKLTGQKAVLIGTTEN